MAGPEDNYPFAADLGAGLYMPELDPRTEEERLAAQAMNDLIIDRAANFATVGGLDAYRAGQSPFEYAGNTAQGIAGGIGQLPKGIVEAFGGTMPGGETIDALSAANPAASGLTSFFMLPPALRAARAGIGAIPAATAAAGVGGYTLTAGSQTADATRDKDFEQIVSQYLKDNPGARTAQLFEQARIAQDALNQVTATRNALDPSKVIAPRMKQANDAVTAAQAAYDKALADVQADERERIGAGRRFADDIMTGRAKGLDEKRRLAEKETPTAEAMYNRLTKDVPFAPPLKTLPVAAGLAMGVTAAPRQLAGMYHGRKQASDLLTRAGTAKPADAARLLREAQALKDIYAPTITGGLKKPAAVGASLAAAPLGYDGYAQPQENPRLTALKTYRDELHPQDPTLDRIEKQIAGEPDYNPAKAAGQNLWEYAKQGGLGALEAAGFYKVGNTTIMNMAAPEFRAVDGAVGRMRASRPDLMPAEPSRITQLYNAVLERIRNGGNPPPPPPPPTGGLRPKGGYPSGGERQALRDAFRVEADNAGVGAVPDTAATLNRMDAAARAGGFEVGRPAATARLGESSNRLAAFQRTEGRNPSGAEWERGTARADPVFIDRGSKGVKPTLSVAGAGVAGAGALAAGGGDGQAAIDDTLDAILDRHDLPGGKSNTTAVKEAVQALRDMGIKASPYQVRRLLTDRGAIFE